MMKVSARSYLTYGIATLGATALVAAPITPITPTPPDVVRSVERAVTNAVSLEDLDLTGLLDSPDLAALLDLGSLDLDALLESLDLESLLDLDSLDPGALLDELLALIPGLSGDGGIGDALGDFIGGFETLFEALVVALGGGTLPGMPPIIDPGLFPALLGLPEQLLALFEGVIDDPATLPNALSNLVYSLFYPLPVPTGPPGAPLLTASLLSIVATPIVGAIAQILPPELSGPFLEAFTAIGNVVVDLLGILPNPGPPFPATSGGLFDGLLDGGLFDGLLDGGLFDGLLGGDPATAAPTGTDAPGIGGLLDGLSGDGLSGGGLFGGGLSGSGLFGLFDRDDAGGETSAELSILSNDEQAAEEEEVATEDTPEEIDGSEPGTTTSRRQITRPSLDFGLFNGNRSGSRSTNVAVNGQPVTGAVDAETTPRHRLGDNDDGRFSVRNIVDRVSGGLDRDRDEDGSQTGTQAEADADE
jgi:hypothetical protein